MIWLPALTKNRGTHCIERKNEGAEKYLETLFDSIEDGIIVINSRHEIIKINSPFLKMIGKEESEVLGRTCHEMIFGLYIHEVKKKSAR